MVGKIREVWVHRSARSDSRQVVPLPAPGCTALPGLRRLPCLSTWTNPRRYLQGVGILSAWLTLTNPGAGCLIQIPQFPREVLAAWGWLPEQANRLHVVGY